MSDSTGGEKLLVPARQFLRMCRSALRRPKVADSTGAEMTGGELLLRTLILRRLLRRHVLAPDETNVGLLLPPSAGAVLANAALAADCRTAVNLNYTASTEVIDSCLRQTGIRHVLSSRRALERIRERFPIEVHSDVVFLEDLREKVTAADKLISAVQARALPPAVLERHLGLARIDPDDVMTLIFTAGATGQPKGVMLTHRNIASNVKALNMAVRLRAEDVMLGVLPFFHSFGYTVTLWTVLSLPPKGVYHYSPLEGREVGKLARRHGATILIATPTFLRHYLRRCAPADFARLDVVIAGAERLPLELAEAFEKKFGVRPVEGYGATEVSPVVSTNVPPSRAEGRSGAGVKDGTVGPPLVGVRAKVIDLDTGEDLGAGRSGMLLVKGPSVMKGYLGRPDLNEQVLRQGWYVTGDVATIDQDGYIKITGRLARYSKLGGEMVPHIRIEEAIIQSLKLEEDDVHVVVTAVPDEKKGERLVVLHTGLPERPEQICRRLAEAGLPPLWIPSPDSFYQVDEIPVLGAGKTDLKQVRQMALQLATSDKTGAS